MLLEVLHPHHKLAYFKAQDWEDPWIETARNLVCEEFNRSYTSFASSNADDADDNAKGSVNNVRFTSPPYFFLTYFLVFSSGVFNKHLR
jgi:hypothetical protein